MLFGLAPTTSRKSLLNAEPQSSTVRSATRLGWFMRGLCACIAGTLGVMWILASGLTPSATGMGTHQQLGLPPCSIRLIFEIPCPACGMTTSWAYLTHGDLISACHANLGGTMLGLLAIAVMPATAWAAIRGQRFTDRTLWGLVFGLSGSMLTAVVQWLGRIGN